MQLFTLEAQVSVENDQDLDYDDRGGLVVVCNGDGKPCVREVPSGLLRTLKYKVIVGRNPGATTQQPQ